MFVPFLFPCCLCSLFQIRTVPQDSQHRHFWASLACIGCENTVFLSHHPHWASESPRFSHISLKFSITARGWHSLGPQGSYCPRSSYLLILSPSPLASPSDFHCRSPPHLGTLSAPRTAPTASRISCSGLHTYCIALHSRSSLHLPPQTRLFRSKQECTYWTLSISTPRRTI